MRQKPKFILFHFWLGQNVGEGGEEGRKEEEEEEEGGEEEEDQKGMFSSWDQVYFDFLRFWFGEWFLLCLGCCGKITQTLDFFGVMWVKPQLV